MDVILKTEKEAQELVQICSQFSFETDVIYNRYIIDAKSILGVLSLGLSKKICVKPLTNDENLKEELFLALKKFEEKGEND